MSNEGVTNRSYPVIMAGGSGTRFWPLSRQLFPKQLLKIIGDETLIQQTMRRVIYAARDRTRHDLHESCPGGIHPGSVERMEGCAARIILCWSRKDAIPPRRLPWSALELVRRDPDAIMLVVPADHIVKDSGISMRQLPSRPSLAAQGLLVTFGIKPIRPETGYGYIKPERKRSLAKQGKLKGHPVGRFVEKPNAAKAAQYLKAGDYYWNSGMFVWRAATILDEIRRHQPVLFRGIERIGQLISRGVRGRPSTMNIDSCRRSRSIQA